MRYTDIEIEELEVWEDGIGSYIVNPTDELIDIMNDIRADLGYTDLVKWELDNDAYYTFYLQFDTNKSLVDIKCEVANGEYDDYVWYDLPITDEEKKMLFCKIINDLLDKLDDMC